MKLLDQFLADDISSVTYLYGIEEIERGKIPSCAGMKKEIKKDTQTNNTDSKTKKTLFGCEIIDRMEGPKPSPVQPHFFTKYGYYLLYDGGVCYYKDKPDNEFPVELIKLIDQLPTPNSTAMYSDDEEMGKADENCSSRFRHMTKSEYDELVKQNLPIDKIELVYQKRFSQTTGFGGGICDNRLKKVFFNFNNSIPVF